MLWFEGVEAICRADYVPVLVEKAAQEEDTIKPLALQLLYNALRQPSGDSLREAQKCNAINVCSLICRCHTRDVLHSSTTHRAVPMASVTRTRINHVQL